MRRLHKISLTSKNSTLIRYFLSYFLIVCLLLLGSFFIIQKQITGIFLDDLTQQTQTKLDNLGRQFREKISSINQIHQSLIGNIDLIQFRFSNDNWKQYQAEKKLKEYTVANPFVDSIVYLDKRHGNLLSSGKYTTYNEGTYTIYDNNIPVSFTPTEYDWSTEQPIFLSNGSSKCLIYCPDTLPNDRYFVFYIINRVELNQMLKDSLSNGITSIALITEDGAIPAGFHTSALEDVLAFEEVTQGIHNIDNNTLLSISQDVYGSYALAALISNTYLKDQVYHTFRTVYILFFLLAGVGFFLMFLGMRSTYLPLYRLVHKVIKRPDSNENYLKLLEESFNNTFSENQQLQLKIEKYRLSMQRSILDSIVADNQSSLPETSPDLESFFNYDSGNRIFAVRLKSTLDEFPLSEALLLLQNLLPQSSTCAILQQEGDCSVFLLNLLEDKKEADKNLNAVLADLHEKYGYLAAFSNSSSSPLDIPSLYEKATFASEHWNLSPVISYNELSKEQEHSSDFSYPYQELDALEQALEDTDFTLSRNILNILFQKIDLSSENEGSLPDFYIRCILIDILTLLGTALNQSNINFKTYRDLYFETLFYCRSCPYNDKKQEINVNTNQLLILLEEEIENASIAGNQIRETVEENYTSPDFSITALADEFHVSVSYMSYLFKKELNQNFSDFLWNLRLEKAKELLLTTELPIDGISIAVGYLNASSFRRKFKQATGISPSQFRSEHDTHI